VLPTASCYCLFIVFARQRAACHLLPYPAGSAGLALALWRAGSLQQNDEWIAAAQQLAGSALSAVASSPRYYVQESLLDGAHFAAGDVHCTAHSGTG
jgi:hypothetical protein